MKYLIFCFTLLFAVPARPSVINTELNPDYPFSEDPYRSFMMSKDSKEASMYEYIEVLRQSYQDSSKEDKDFKTYFEEECFNFMNRHTKLAIDEQKTKCDDIRQKYYDEKKARADQEDKYIPSTCEWSNDIPRRIISSPGCTTGKTNNTCVGYVVCDSKVTFYDDETKKNISFFKKFVRMSSCSSENCGEQDAVKCTLEKGFSSKKGGEDENISQQLWNIISPTKASEQ